MGLPIAWEEVFRQKGMMPRPPGHPAVLAAGLPANPNGTGRIKGSVACVGVPTADPEGTTVVVPLDLPNPLNMGGKALMGWRLRAGKHHRVAVRVAFLAIGETDRTLARFAAGCEVRMTRVGPRRMADDAVPGALKHVRDVVAQMIFGGEIR
jgi:hypothetical protein